MNQWNYHLLFIEQIQDGSQFKVAISQLLFTLEKWFWCFTLGLGLKKFNWIIEIIICQLFINKSNMMS